MFPQSTGAREFCATRIGGMEDTCCAEANIRCITPGTLLILAASGNWGATFARVGSAADWRIQSAVVPQCAYQPCGCDAGVSRPTVTLDGTHALRNFPAVA